MYPPHPLSLQSFDIQSQAASEIDPTIRTWASAFYHANPLQRGLLQYPNYEYTFDKTSSSGITVCIKKLGAVQEVVLFIQTLEKNPPYFYLSLYFNRELYLEFWDSLQT